MLTSTYPLPIELVIQIDAATLIPLALVDLDHLSGDAGDAIVGEVVWGIGPDAIDRILRHGSEQIQ
jgi:5'-3' exonuclease